MQIIKLKNNKRSFCNSFRKLFKKDKINNLFKKIYRVYNRFYLKKNNRFKKDIRIYS